MNTTLFLKPLLLLSLWLGSWCLTEGNTALAGEKKQDKPLYMWLDCEANFERLSYPDSVDFYLEKVKQVGFTDLVVDVKSIMGETLFKSKYAPYMDEWKGVVRPDKYDMVKVILKKARKHKLGVYASLNVFSGGHNFFDRGIIYGDHADWQSINYWMDGLRPISEMKWNYNGMLNPALPEVQEYQLNIIREFVKMYPSIKGIILDRMRYDGITSDFSPRSKAMFEDYAGIKVEKFPEDVIYWAKDENGADVWKRGKHFNQWIEWRATIIHDFCADARKTVKDIDSDIDFGIYAGAWYPVYYELGVNWASKKYNQSVKYDWATKNYRNTGYAELLDLFMGGLYFKEVTIEEVEKMNEEMMANRTEAAMGKGREYWYSVEGCADMTNELIQGATPFCGSIYVDQYEGDEEQFARALKMALDKSDGLMLFDIVHIIDRNWWDLLSETLKQ